MTIDDFWPFDIRFVYNADGGRWRRSGIRIEIGKRGWEWTWR